MAKNRAVTMIRLVFWLGAAATLTLLVLPSDPEPDPNPPTSDILCLGREQYDDSTYVDYFFDRGRSLIRRHLFVDGELKAIDVTILSPPHGQQVSYPPFSTAPELRNTSDRFQLKSISHSEPEAGRESAGRPL